jgi:predicted XRE-type DNA-binding protein
MSKKGYEVGSRNVFKDLGIPNAEEHLIKAQLVFKIDSIMKSRRLKQAEAAELLSCSVSNGPMSQTCCAESFVSSRWNDCCAFSLRSITMWRLSSSRTVGETTPRRCMSLENKGT